MSEIGATAEITSAYQNQRVNPLFTGFSKSILSQIDQRKLIDHVRNHRPSKKDTLIPDVKSNEDITFRPLIYKIEFNKQTYIVRKKASQISGDQDNHLNIRDQLKINKLLYNYLQKCIKKEKIDGIKLLYFDIACVDPEDEFIVIEYKAGYKNLLEHQIIKIKGQDNNKEIDRLNTKHRRIKQKVNEFRINIVDNGVKIKGIKGGICYRYDDPYFRFVPDTNPKNILYGGVDQQGNDIFYLMDLFYIDHIKKIKK